MAMANFLIVWLLVSGVATLVAHRRIRRPRFILLTVLHAVGIFIVYNLVMPTNANIRVDLLLTVPLLLVIIAGGVRTACHRKPPAGGLLAPSQPPHRD